jgi:DHA1 family tetracycline resistance protein-like MFS transporter
VTRDAPGASIAFILFTVFMSVLGIGLIIPVLPALITELSGGELSGGARVYGLFVAVYAAMQFLFAPVMGALSDRFGRRPVLIVSVFGAALDYLVMALAPTLAWLFAARLVAGVVAANISVANAYIADITPAAERAKRFGLIGAAFGLGFIIAPAIGGVLGSFGLRTPFFAAAAVAMLNGLYGLLVLPESLPAERRRRFEWKRASPIGSILSLRTFKGVAGLALVIATLNFAQANLQAVWVLFTGFRFGWGPLENGATLAVLGILTAAMQGAGIKPMLKRFGEVRAVIIGLSASALAFTAYAFIPEGWMILLVMLVGALGGVSGPAILAMVSRNVSEDLQGSAQGALASISSLAAIASPLIATALFAAFTAPGASLTFAGAPFLFGTLTIVVALMLFVATTRGLAAAEKSAP